jgi:UDP-glucose 4-epimerase
MKIVITGGCGYIGSHITRYLKQHNENCSVYIIDRQRRDHTLKNVDGFLHTDYVSRQSLLWLDELQPDVIVHCAGDISVGESVDDPAKYYDNNVAKTITFLNHVKDYKKKPLVLFSSSASVYGNPDRVPLVETDRVKPISPYGHTKNIIEVVLQNYNQAYGLPSVCFRYFNAAGAEPFNHNLGQQPGAGHIIARLLEAKINNKSFTLNGTDYQTPDRTCIRDYIHVWDLADAHHRAIHWNTNRSAAIFNLGTNKGISNQEIIDYVNLHYGVINVILGPRRSGDPDQLIADASLAHKVLGWQPNYSSIDQIIDSAYKWYTTNGEA